MANIVYNSFKKKIADGSIDLDSDTIKVMLVTSAYLPDVDNHDFKDDITNEVSGTGYTAGGQALANKAVIQDNSGDKAIFDADDLIWTNSTITARGAVIYKDTGVASTSPLICYIDFGSDKSSYGGDFKIEWSSQGILSFS